MGVLKQRTQRRKCCAYEALACQCNVKIKVKNIYRNRSHRAANRYKRRKILVVGRKEQMARMSA